MCIIPITLGSCNNEHSFTIRNEGFNCPYSHRMQLQSASLKKQSNSYLFHTSIIQLRK